MVFTTKNLLVKSQKNHWNLEDLQSLWKALSTCALETLNSKKGFRIPNLGTITYVRNSERTTQQKDIFFKRVFFMDRTFENIYHLEADRPGPNLLVNAFNVNYSKLATLTGLDKDHVRGMLDGIVAALGQALQQNSKVKIEFYNVGHIVSINQYVKFKFNENLTVGVPKPKPVPQYEEKMDNISVYLRNFDNSKLVEPNIDAIRRRARTATYGARTNSTARYSYDGNNSTTSSSNRHKQKRSNTKEQKKMEESKSLPLVKHSEAFDSNDSGMGQENTNLATVRKLLEDTSAKPVSNEIKERNEDLMKPPVLIKKSKQEAPKFEIFPKFGVSSHKIVEIDPNSGYERNLKSAAERLKQRLDFEQKKMIALDQQIKAHDKMTTDKYFKDRELRRMRDKENRNFVVEQAKEQKKMRALEKYCDAFVSDPNPALAMPQGKVYRPDEIRERQKQIREDLEEQINLKESITRQRREAEEQQDKLYLDFLKKSQAQERYERLMRQAEERKRLKDGWARQKELTVDGAADFFLKV